MANQFETPFMPQQTLLKVESGQRPREPLNLSLILALIIFFATLAISGGAYFYKDSVDKQVIAKGEELKAAEKLFDVSKIDTYKTLQTTLVSAKNLVDNHTIFSLIFDLLEARAAENIGLTSLSFGQDGSMALLTLTGQAPSYEAAYYQVQKWRESKPVIKNVEVTSLFLEETSGIVSFGVKMSIDASTLGYGKMLAASAPKTAVATSTTPSVVTPKPATATSTSVLMATSTSATTSVRAKSTGTTTTPR